MKREAGCETEYVMSGEGDVTLAEIVATPEAQSALRDVMAEHGPIMFHTSGGRVGGRQFPICLPEGALRLGGRDHLLGRVMGVAIYEMEDRDGRMRSRSAVYVLDVQEGLAIGFSLAAGLGRRFCLTVAQVEPDCCGGEVVKT